MKNNIYTVTQLNNHAKSILENNLNSICVAGEISTFTHYNSGHAYFQLKDNKSEISCTWFNYNRTQNLSVGKNVTIFGKVTIYSQRGKYQIVVSDSFLTGIGDHWINFQKLKEKLLKEGLFASENKKVLPSFPETIGVVSSIHGAVIQDITNILNRRAPYITLVIADTRVQGDNASNLICHSINKLNTRSVDLIILARGGGSNEELMVFNDEKLARTIFKSKIPIISAVGHETDFTIADLVADIRASTPSEAAELCTEDKEDLLQRIDFLTIRINNIFLNLLKFKKIEVSELFSVSLIKGKLISINSLNERVLMLYKNLVTRVFFYIERELKNLTALKNNLNKGNIDKLKKIGFSILRKNGKLINDISKVNINDTLSLELKNGLLNIKVKEKIKNEEE